MKKNNYDENIAPILVHLQSCWGWLLFVRRAGFWKGGGDGVHFTPPDEFEDVQYTVYDVYCTVYDVRMYTVSDVLYTAVCLRMRLTATDS